jgi:hypothetical protein
MPSTEGHCGGGGVIMKPRLQDRLLSIGISLTLIASWALGAWFLTLLPWVTWTFDQAFFRVVLISVAMDMSDRLIERVNSKQPDAPF